MSLSLARWLFVASLALVVLLLISRVTEKPARVDTFARQVECRKTAEALIGHLEHMHLNLHPSWQAHFSPKYGHCYAQVFNMDIGATELFDALENQALATWVGDAGDENVGSYTACELPGEPPTFGAIPPHYPARCNHAQAYIIDHMEN